ncbi:GntR family transcriptional regulator [Caballeronia udeis]|uniref:GntR family transcriptional regulator n=2 Tax=Caballeronia udeis TaxID=1232866 RepID=A0A158JIH9_9BURK|nr:GntR family transcriptional regulator [Caballeronia udeis]
MNSGDAKKETSVRRPAQQFRAVKPQRVFEEICSQIRQDLSDGKLRPGDKLPAERILAEQFSVSRAALREALRSLEGAGIVKLLKGTNGGAVILDGTRNTVAQSIADFRSLGRVSLSEIAEARILIQETIVRLAVHRATDEDIEALEENVRQTAEFVAQKDFEARMEASLEFYRLLALCTGNQLLVIINDALATILRPYVMYVVKSFGYDIVRHRRRFLKHLKDRNESKAVGEITSHLSKIHSMIEPLNNQ